MFLEHAEYTEQETVSCFDPAAGRRLILERKIPINMSKTTSNQLFRVLAAAPMDFFYDLCIHF